MNRVVVCMGCCCPHMGGTELFAELRQKLNNRKNVLLQHSDCVGPCSKGPNVLVNDKIVYRAHADEVIEEINSAEQISTSENT